MQTGRIIQEHKTNYLVATEAGEVMAVVRGSFHTQKDFPKVGDYVSYTNTGDDEVVIEEVHPRRTVITRASQARDKRDGGVVTEVLVANVDIVFIVMGLDLDFNISRIERYASLAAASRVEAVVLLNKCDTVSDADSYVAQVRRRVPQLAVHAVSAMSGQGMEVMLEYLHDETTAVLLGSSGAGKSTMTNWLLQRPTQSVQEVREEDSRGRHTTTARQLFAIPTGGFLIDTPGMRELGVSGGAEEVFTSIETLARQCRFSDCDHRESAGCAVQEALAQGEVSEEQLANYLKLQREHEYIESKTSKESQWQYHQHRKKQGQKGQKIIQSKYKMRGVK